MTQEKALEKARRLSIENQTVAVVYLDSFYNSYHACLYEEFVEDEDDVIVAFDNGRQTRSI